MLRVYAVAVVDGFSIVEQKLLCGIRFAIFRIRSLLFPLFHTNKVLTFRIREKIALRVHCFPVLNQKGKLNFVDCAHVFHLHQCFPNGGSQPTGGSQPDVQWVVTPCVLGLNSVLPVTPQCLIGSPWSPLLGCTGPTTHLLGLCKPQNEPPK